MLAKPGVVLNGLVFLLIGLDLPEISEGLKRRDKFATATGYRLLIVATLIVVRFLHSFGAVILTRIASNFITVADKIQDIGHLLCSGWTGLRRIIFIRY